jgi:hypothetical protein
VHPFSTRWEHAFDASPEAAIVEALSAPRGTTIQAMSNASPMLRNLSFLSLIPLDLASVDEDQVSYFFDAAIIDPYTVVKDCAALKSGLKKMGSLGGSSVNTLLANLGVSCVEGVMTREANADAVNRRLFCNGKGKVRLSRLTSVVGLQIVLWGRGLRWGLLCAYSGSCYGTCCTCG